MYLISRLYMITTLQQDILKEILKEFNLICIKDPRRV